MAKINLNGFKKIRNELRKDKLYHSIGKTAVREVKKSIVSGLSPVKGQGRFQRYSPSYLDQIDNSAGAAGRYGKKPLPVNLILSGKMLNSLRYSISAGVITITFTDKKAIYHDYLGAGRSKVKRRMLPTIKGEKFTARINKELRKELTELKRLLIKLGNSA